MRSPRYSSLPFLASVIRVFGYLLLIWAFFSAALAWVIPPEGTLVIKTAIFTSLRSFFQNIFWGVVTLAVSDVLLVLMDIEENTRRTTEALLGARTLATPRAEQNVAGSSHSQS